MVEKILYTPRILIVDDTLSNVEVLGYSLSGEYLVQFATSGPEALRLMEEQQLPDLILLDVMMPEMNGYEVFEKLAENPNTRNIPVIFVTAYNDVETETSALACGAVDFIPKPINQHVVRARVRTQIALKQRETELRQANANLEQQVQERTQALCDALHKAETANYAKNVFLSNMSHEIHTPLNAILGFVHILLRGNTDDTSRGHLEKIQKSAQKLLYIMDGILDLSRIQSCQMPIEQIDFNLDSVVNSVFDVLNKDAKEKGINLIWNRGINLPQTLKGDPIRLRQILLFFLENAIKFSSVGNITCRAKQERLATGELMLRLEVEDHGIGIEPTKQAQVFNVFEQLDASPTRQYGGNGLGLGISKLLAEMMGGEVGVTSALGRGSVFWVKIPWISANASEVSNGIVDLVDTGDKKKLYQIFNYLHGFLEEFNSDALVVWQVYGSILKPLLGSSLSAFELALEDYDFKTALQLLQIVENENFANMV